LFSSTKLTTSAQIKNKILNVIRRGRVGGKLKIVAKPDHSVSNSAWEEGTGTRPDNIVNRVLTKNEGPHPKIFVRKSRNSCRVNNGDVGAHGQWTRSSNVLSPETNTNTQRILSLSRLLRSAWHPLASNCWSFPHSLSSECRYPPWESIFPMKVGLHFTT